MSKLDHPAFRDDDAARAYLEGVRWADGPVCPHCGERNRIYKVRSKAARPGVYKCGYKACRKQFTVTVGTLFERSKVPLHKWMQATFLLCSSQKGISSHQLHRILGVTYQTAWFMTQRLRQAMRERDPFTPPTPTGGAGRTVQADETSFGKTADQAPPTARQGRACKREKLVTTVRRDTIFWTHESRLYPEVGRADAGHSAVNHRAAPHGERNSHWVGGMKPV